MTIVKVGDNKYINVDRMTYVEPARKSKLIVHFAVGGGDISGPPCHMTLQDNEAETFERWLSNAKSN